MYTHMSEQDYNDYQDELNSIGEASDPFGYAESARAEARRFEEIMQAEVDEENEIWAATLHFPKRWSYVQYPIVKLDMDTDKNNPDYVWF